MALAIVAAAVLYLFIPSEFRISTSATIGYPVELAVLLAVLIIGDPGRIDRDVPWLRVVTTVLLLTITTATMTSVVRLIVGILQKASFTSPGQLLIIGAVVWVTNVIAFALWYWHLDSRGPAARASGHLTVRPAYHFPEQSLPDVVGARWYPQFVDYFALSFNTATAFSPTDVSAIRPWAKIMLICESAVSLALVALVVARAVNVL
jgi:hypothetical protein